MVAVMNGGASIAGWCNLHMGYGRCGARTGLERGGIGLPIALLSLCKSQSKPS
jgi:hypothetical protein